MHSENQTFRLSAPNMMLLESSACRQQAWIQGFGQKEETGILTQEASTQKCQSQNGPC